MPVLSTFGGASARSFGRAIEVQPPVFPAGTAVLWDNNVSTGVPTGWSYLQEADNKFILATNTDSEINSTMDLSGSLTVSSNISMSNGSHTGGLFYTSRYGTAASGGTDVPSSANHTGHSHYFGGSTLDISDTSSYAGDEMNPDYIQMPIIYTDTAKDTLPPDAIVFRGNAPSSPNYLNYRTLLDNVRSVNIKCAQTKNKSEPYYRDIIYGLSTSAGSHYHPYEKRLTGTASTTADSYTTTGNHVHPVKYSIRLEVKTKFLRLWKSQIEESLENGMIVMYLGSIANLPSGWRLCDGNNGTPSMGGYYVGTNPYDLSELSHGSIIYSVTKCELVSVSLEEILWNHGHQGNSFTTSRNRKYSAHMTINAPHRHSVLSSRIDDTSSGYTPPTYTLCFIQYKGL
jgi:hypothetical protein